MKPLDPSTRARYLLLASTLLLTPALCPGQAGSPTPSPTYPISADVVTTRQRTVTPVALNPDPYVTPRIAPKDVASWALFGYTGWQPFGPPEDEGRKFLTPDAASSSPNVARLLNFFAMSDVHITDFQSPAQVLYLGWAAPFGAGRAADGRLGARRCFDGPGPRCGDSDRQCAPSPDTVRFRNLPGRRDQ